VAVLRIALLTALILLATPVFAGEQPSHTDNQTGTLKSKVDDSGRWYLRGYGTFGINQDDNRPHTAFARDISQLPKDSYTTSSLLTDDAWLRDSRLGLQFGYQFTPTASIVSQVVLRDQVSTKLTHFVDWAFLAFKPSPKVDTRIGRVGFDVFMMSEQRNVGYIVSERKRLILPR
jgi:hypothetical protein